MSQLHLRTGAAALIDVFLPLNDQNGFIIVITHRFAGDKVRVRLPDHLLPLQQLPGLVDQGLDHRRVIGDAKTVGIGHRGHSGAFFNGVDFADIGQVTQSVTGGIVHIDIQILCQAEPAGPGHSGGSACVRMDIQHDPKQGNGRDTQEDQAGKAHQHLGKDVLFSHGFFRLLRLLRLLRLFRLFRLL